MTREEAINKAWAYLTSCLPIEDYEEVDEIIKAIEQPCEDAVSRQAVLDMATAIQTDDCSGNEIVEVVDINDVKTLPSVTPAHKKSKWITKYHGFPPEPTTACLKCGFDRDFYIRSVGFDKIKFCPNCGRKMEE